MMPIQDLFNKLKWDEHENPFAYTFFYLDRVANKLREVKYKDIAEVKDGYMTVVREDDEVQIPLHRIRVVKRDGVVVWERPGPVLKMAESKKKRRENKESTFTKNNGGMRHGR